MQGQTAASNPVDKFPHNCSWYFADSSGDSYGVQFVISQFCNWINSRKWLDLGLSWPFPFRTSRYRRYIPFFAEKKLVSRVATPSAETFRGSRSVLLQKGLQFWVRYCPWIHFLYFISPSQPVNIIYSSQTCSPVAGSVVYIIFKISCTIARC